MSIFAELEVCKGAGPRSAAMNMAIDEALLQTAELPSIRFYRWNSPSLSFGYFGRFSNVARYAAERDLVRRWTGGGIVFHGDDLTYSIIIPAHDEMFVQSSAFIYAAIHSALCDVLDNLGLRAALVGPTDPDDAGAAVNDRGYNGVCFANPVRADVLVNGRKVAGAAQRRTRAGLLHQGSIQLATGRVRPTVGHVDLGNDLSERFVNELSANHIKQKLDDDILNRAHEIAARKYETADWLQRR